MKKKPKKGKFKIPSKPGKKAPKFAYKNPTTLSDNELKRVEKADDIYYVAMRNFYNSIVPKEFKSGSKTLFGRITRTVGNLGYFGMVSQGDDILFSFMGTEEEKPPELALGKVIEDTGNVLNPVQETEKILKELAIFNAKMSGFEPFKKKVLCVVQEEPTDFFLDKDEVTLDINDEEYRKFAGKWKYDLIEYLKDNLGTTDVLFKVINKVNNPEAYKNYLVLKHVMDKIDELGVIGM